MARHEPIFNAPRSVVVLLAGLILVHLVRQALSPEMEDWVIGAGAFIPARYSGEDLPGGAVAKVTSFLTHAFLHGDFTHLAVNGGWLLAFGTIVARRLDGLRFAVLFVLSAVAGAALFLVMNPGLPQPMVGASGAISGMMGAAIRFMFQPASMPADDRNPGGHAPLMTLGQMMQDPRARMMIVSWLALNLLFGLVLGTLISAGGIAWEAHLGGFFAGMLALPLIERSGRSGRSPDDQARA